MSHFRFVLTLGILAVSAAQANADPPPGPPPGVIPTPQITGITPSFGQRDNQVKVTGSNLGFAQSVMFGDQRAISVQQADGSLLVYAPYGAPGSTVPVTTTDIFGRTVGSSATFSFSIGEMDVNGPLPLDPNEFDGGTAWFNGRGHLFSFNVPGTLTFGVPAPVFHILTTFWDTGDTPVYPPDPPPFDVGIQGRYDATLDFCDVTQTPPSPAQACNNWDNNQGTWSVVGSTQTLTLDKAGPFKTAEGDIALDTNGLFDTAHLARTFRIRTGLEQLDSHFNPRRSDGFTTPPFNAAVIPSALMEIRALPYLIIYHPPGNQSTATINLTSTYGTSFKIGNSTTTGNSWSETSSSGVQFAAKGAGFAGFGGNLGAGSSLDQTIKTGYGVTDDTGSTGASSVGIQSTWKTKEDTNLAAPGNGDTCASLTDCGMLKHHSDTYWHEPFWQDKFVLLVHPQFATWVLGNGEDRYVMLGAVPVTVDFLVGDLAACAAGQRPYGLNPCKATYSTDNISSADGKPFPVLRGTKPELILTPNDAVNLLKLDPFYRNGQGADIPSTRQIQIASPAYGSKIGEPAQGSTDITVTNNEQTTTTQGGTLENTATVTIVRGNSASIGLSIDSGGLGEGITIDNKEQNTLEQSMKVSYTDSTAVSSERVSSASVSLNDVDNTQLPSCQPCHDPVPDRASVNIVLDRVFGTFMFQDPTAPGEPPECKPFVCNQLISSAAANALEAYNRKLIRFVDVRDGGRVQSAVGILTRFGIVAGFADGTYRPNRPLTRMQLASMLAAALDLPPAHGTSPYRDLRAGTPSVAAARAVLAAHLIRPPRGRWFDGDEAVSRQEFANSLGLAFNASLARVLNQGTAKQLYIAEEKRIAPWALNNVRRTVVAGYMTLNPQGDFRPHDAVARGEAAVALVAALKDKGLQLSVSSTKLANDPSRQ
jgi:S-layer homology domain